MEILDTSVVQVKCYKTFEPQNLYYVQEILKIGSEYKVTCKLNKSEWVKEHLKNVGAIDDHCKLRIVEQEVVKTEESTHLTGRLIYKGFSEDVKCKTFMYEGVTFCIVKNVSFSSIVHKESGLIVINGDNTFENLKNFYESMEKNFHLLDEAIKNKLSYICTKELPLYVLLHN